MEEPKSFSEFLKFKEEIEKFIKKAVHSEFEKHEHSCRFNITDADMKDVSHGLGMLGDLGAGRASAGIEVIRDNQIWLQKQRERGEKIASKIIFVIITSLVSAGLFAFWEGFKTKILGMFGS